MIRTLLENNVVPEGSLAQSVESLEKEYQKRQLEMAEKYKGIVDSKLIFENSYAQTGEDCEDADYSHEEVLAVRHDFNDKLDVARDEVQLFNNELAMFKRYGKEFSYLHRIKEIEDCTNEGVKLEMVEIAKDYERGTLTDDNYYFDLAGGKNAEKEVALRIELDEDTPAFYFSVQPHDNPTTGNREEQLKIGFDEDDLQKLSKENLQKILAFCESHGFSTLSADFPFSLDGLENEDKFHDIFNELQRQAKMRDELESHKLEQLDERLAKEEDYSLATEQNGNEAQNEDEGALATETADENSESTSVEPSAADELYGNFATSGGSKSLFGKLVDKVKKPFVRNHATPAPEPSAPKIKRKDFEEKIEKKVLYEGLGKEKGLSYFKCKASSSLFGSSWTVYTVFDSPDEKNLAENGRRDKNGKAKYTYSYKLYVNQSSDGTMHFAYHMRENKKVNEDMVNSLVGQFKDAGITHIRFPHGVPDSDKKIWRIALAEKGIVPVNMSLDRSKAQGMLEAAKKKLSDEEYAKFKFRLGKQMKDHYESKGKNPDTSEKEYIDSLISSHYYDPFVNAYNAVLKGGLSQKLRAAGKDTKMGAAKKVALYYAFSRMFSVYDSVVKKGTIAQSPEFRNHPEEVRRIKAAGLDIEPHKLTKEQLVELYELLLPRCLKEAAIEVEEALMQAKDSGNVAARGAKRADNIILKEIFDAARNGFEDVNERLKNNGCDEIAMPKVMGRLQYDIFYDKHPEFLRRNPTNNQAPKTNNTNGGSGRQS